MPVSETVLHSFVDRRRRDRLEISVGAILRLLGRGDVERDLRGRTARCPLEIAPIERTFSISMNGLAWRCGTCEVGGDAVDLGVCVGFGQSRAAVLVAVGRALGIGGDAVERLAAVEAARDRARTVVNAISQRGRPSGFVRS